MLFPAEMPVALDRAHGHRVRILDLRHSRRVSPRRRLIDRSWRLHIQGLVRSHLVVVFAPALHQHLGLFERVKQLAAQQFGFRQQFLGPRDTNSPTTDSLLSGFSPKRLRGEAPPLPAEYALTPSDELWRLPHYGGNGCKAIGVTPEDVRQGIAAPPPANFNTLPATLPAYN